MANDPRDIAVWALEDRNGNVSKRLAQLLDRNTPGPADRSLARELALGVCRRRSTVRALLRAFMDDPDRRLPGVISEILMVGAYQLVFLDRIPDHAAINEAVEQAVRHRHKRQGGMVNGVLRTIARKVGEAVEEPAPLKRKAIPIDAGRHCMSDRPIFPDPAHDPTGYLAAAHSMPMPLASRWLTEFGSLGVAAEIASHANTRAPMILRVSPLADPSGDTAAAVEAVLASLREDGVEACAHENGRSVVLPRGSQFGELRAFREGWAQVQDPTATAVVDAAELRPGMRVLDFCAAPGTKTTHIAEEMRGDGEIVALDVSQDKLGRIEENCGRMGHTNVRTMLAEQAGSLEPESFDVVLADVPCTNTGVLARRAEARWRFSSKSLERAVRDQRDLMALAARFVRPGGRFVYSTCSIEPEENSGAVAWMAERAAGFELLHEKLTLPGGATTPERWRDGGHCAVFRRR